MRREFINIQTGLTAVFIGMILFAGCGKEENQVINPTGPTGGTGWTGGGTGLGGGNGGGGPGSATPSPTPTNTCPTKLPPAYPNGFNGELIPASSAAFSAFASARPWFGKPNCPGPINANLDFNPYGGTPKVYLGFFTINYYDSPYGSEKEMKGYMDNGYPNWSWKDGNYIHQIYEENGQKYVRIMVEDRFGAVTIIMRPGTGGSDSSVGKWTARVYFYNFTKPTSPNPRYDVTYIWEPGFGWRAIAPNPQNFCWGNLLKDGPYRCKNLSVPPTSDGNYPFTYLGIIKNVDLNEALGI